MKCVISHTRVCSVTVPQEACVCLQQFVIPVLGSAGQKSLRASRQTVPRWFHTKCFGKSAQRVLFAEILPQQTDP